MVEEKRPGIIWLASYPKSGNTWLRIFLANYMQETDEPVDINRLDGEPIASARSVFDDLAGVEASDLTPEEIERYRPGIYIHIAQNLDKSIFLKVHDAYTYNQDGIALFPRTATQAVIYLIRNPLDVTISFAHHSNCTIDEMIDRMSNPNNAFCDRDNRLHNQLRQKLLTWSGHVLSWVDESGLPVFVVRYEDMILDTVSTFTRIVIASHLQVNHAKLVQSLEFTEFERLQEMERDHGFRERAPRAKSFFRKGTVGDWRQVLSEVQAKQIIDAHNEVMTRFGYLAEDEQPIF